MTAVVTPGEDGFYVVDDLVTPEIAMAGPFRSATEARRMAKQWNEITEKLNRPIEIGEVDGRPR